MLTTTAETPDGSFEKGETMSWSGKFAICMLAVFVLVLVPGLRAEEKVGDEVEEGPKIDVVFCLDSTGSMGGEIQAAKDKIWSIANKLMKGKPEPEIRFGVVTFRDKGDAYRVKCFDLTADIDAVHGFLKGIQAGGGGDGPEDVRMALRDSVEKMSWSKDAEALKMIFLVGDAPPHTDYAELPSCEATARKAIARGISVNTIACGGLGGEGLEIWKKLAKVSDGTFQSLERHGYRASSALYGAPGGAGMVRRSKAMMYEGAELGAMEDRLDAPAAAPAAAIGGGPASAESSADFEKAILDAVKRKAAKKGVEF